MKTLRFTAQVSSERTLAVQLPPGVTPGATASVVVVVQEESPAPAKKPLRFPNHTMQLIDPNFTFRREDLYGDDGR